MFLDECDLSAESRRADGGNQSCRAAANDNEVVTRRGRGIFPVRRMNVRNKFLIVRVPRLDGWLGRFGLRLGFPTFKFRTCLIIY